MSNRSLRFLGLICVGCASLLGQPAGLPYHFNLLATQSGSGGSVDGVASDARFLSPAGIVLDAQGDLIVADTTNHAIRKVAPDGRVTTIAGWLGHPGSRDGQGSAASFYKPTGVALDRVGNIIVADYGNLLVRRISPQGVVTTIAGAGNPLQPFPSDGIGAAVTFIGPNAVATDAAGNIYVADSSSASGTASAFGTAYSTTIRKITPDGIVTTIAGHRGFLPSGLKPVVTPTDLFLNFVSCLTLDAAGNLYFSDVASHSYFFDGDRATLIIKITPGGVITTLARYPAGSPSSGMMTTGIALDAGGNIFLSDSTDHVVLKLTPDGAMTTIAGFNGSAGNVDGAAANARFNGPGGLAMATDGTLFLSDTGNNTLRKIAAGGVTTLAGHPATATSLEQFLANSTGLAVDAGGNLYAVADHAILKLSATGTLTTLAGTAGQAGSSDGTGANASFTSIRYLAVDTKGDLYLIEGNAIRKVTSSGVVTTLAGDITESGSKDATGAAARFSSPSNLTVDAAGNVYVGDSGNFAVRQVTPGGVVTTFAGAMRLGGQIDGDKSDARFWGPFDAIAYDDTSGTLYVAEYGHLRKIAANGSVSTLQITSRTGLKVIDHSGRLFAAEGVLTAAYIYRIFPWTINEITAAGSPFLVGGGLDIFPVGGTGSAAIFGESFDALTVAPDGRMFVRGGHALFVGAPNLASVAATASYTTPGNQAVAFPLPASDPDGDARTYTITGTTNGTATLAGNLATFTPASGATGTGSVSFTASDGYTTSATGTVNITVTPAVTLLANISTRGRVGTGDNVLIAGFVLNGPAGTPKTVLVRAAGPSLAAYGVSQPLSRPVITLMQGPLALMSNQGWSTAGNATDIASVGSAVSAFSFAPGSNDSAVLTQLLPGAYTIVVSGADGGGIGLAEVYDSETANPAHHPVNVSSRGFVGTGNDVLIAGFVVKGDSPQKFLIRAVGLGLSVANLAGRLADPQLHLYQGPSVIQHITGWTNDAAMQAATSQTGAFPLLAGSADAAAIVTLAPGSYTAMVSSQSGASGIALVEVYQLP